jgi:hypothetical protein
LIWNFGALFWRFEVLGRGKRRRRKKIWGGGGGFGFFSLLFFVVVVGGMGLATRAAADASITFLWVFSMASLGAVSSALAPIIGLQGGSGKLYVVLALVTLLIFVFSALGKALGGASWNPTSLVAFAYAGVSKDTLFSLGIRMPAQVWYPF